MGTLLICKGKLRETSLFKVLLKNVTTIAKWLLQKSVYERTDLTAKTIALDTKKQRKSLLLII